MAAEDSEADLFEHSFKNSFVSTIFWLDGKPIDVRLGSFLFFQTAGAVSKKTSAKMV